VPSRIKLFEPEIIVTWTDNRFPELDRMVQRTFSDRQDQCSSVKVRIPLVRPLAPSAFCVCWRTAGSNVQITCLWEIFLNASTFDCHAAILLWQGWIANPETYRCACACLPV
jgi:hypothetical protein